MALEGTIKEFGLADIFQLIGLQKKTGILFLKSAEETINIHFEDGNVVKAEESKKRPKHFLGRILINRRKITEPQLRECMEIQKNTGQKIGGVLISQGLINRDDLRDALSFQITEAVYKVFRWKDGDYKFDQERVDYDRDTVTPLSTEHILMDGIRMLDEWPQIDKKLPSMSVVLKKTEEAYAIVDDEGDVFAGFAEKMKEGGVSNDSKHILGIVDGKKSVLEIIDMSKLGEFDTCKTIVDLLGHRLITTTDARPELLKDKAPFSYEQPQLHLKSESRIGMAVYVFIAVAFVILFMQLTGTRKIMDPRVTKLEDLKQPFAVTIVNKDAHAMDAYFLDYGAYPDTTLSLEQLDYIYSSDTSDPWGGKILIEKDELGNYYTVSAGPDRVLHSPDDIKSDIDG